MHNRYEKDETVNEIWFYDEIFFCSNHAQNGSALWLGNKEIARRSLIKRNEWRIHCDINNYEFHIRFRHSLNQTNICQINSI